MRILNGILFLKVEGLMIISQITLIAINMHIKVSTSNGNEPKYNFSLTDADPNPKK